MFGPIFDRYGKQIGFVKDGFAHDRQGQPIFKLDGTNLMDLTAGEVICHLTAAGLANTPGHESDGDASRHFTKGG